MTKFLLNLIIFAFALSFLGCESKNSYNINSDKAVLDMNTRITELEDDLNTLTTELKDVRKVLEDPDIDTQLRASIRREIHEGEVHEKALVQWIDFLKIRRKKRYNSLVDRKNQENLKEQAEKEVKAYFVEKKLKPIDKKWKKRYKTAIEL